jgi:RNA polymerase sigma-70 factor (ECF subfamily)
MTPDERRRRVLQWLAGHQQALTAFLRRQSLQPADADDLLHDLIVWLLTTTQFAPWDYAEAQALRFVRTHLLHQIGTLRRQRARDAARRGPEPKAPDAVPDTERPPAAAAIAAEQRERAWRCLEQLSADERDLLQLHYWHGMPYAEITQARGLGHAQLASRLHRARQRFAALFGRDPFAAL